jgi:hypothetical protein
MARILPHGWSTTAIQSIAPARCPKVDSCDHPGPSGGMAWRK